MQNLPLIHILSAIRSNASMCKTFTNNINSKMNEIPINLYNIFLKCCACKHDIGEGYYVTLNEYVQIFMEWCNLVYCTPRFMNGNTT